MIRKSVSHHRLIRSTTDDTSSVGYFMGNDVFRALGRAHRLRLKATAHAALSCSFCHSLLIVGVHNVLRVESTMASTWSSSCYNVSLLLSEGRVALIKQVLTLELCLAFFQHSLNFHFSYTPLHVKL